MFPILTQYSRFIWIIGRKCR